MAKRSITRSILFFCGLLAGPLALAQQSMRISSYIATGLGADLGQYEATMRMTRDQTRQAYMNEVTTAIERMAQATHGNVAPEALIGPLMLLQEVADGKRDQHRAADAASLDYTLSEFFKSEIERLYGENRLARSERKIEFVDVYTGGARNFDHYLTLGLTHLSGNSYRATLRVGSLQEGLTKVFDGSGTIQSALSQVAQKLFLEAHQPEAVAWNNPNPQIQLIPGPGNRMTENDAKIFCRGQNARIATSEELRTAQQAGNVRAGGIARFAEGDVFIVGDQLRQATTTWALTVRGYDAHEINLQPLPTFGAVVCAKGEKSERQQVIDAIYSLRRQVDRRGSSLFFAGDLQPDVRENVVLIENLLLNISAPGAESADLINNNGGGYTTEEILSLLDQKGLISDARGQLIRRAEGM